MVRETAGSFWRYLGIALGIAALTTLAGEAPAPALAAEDAASPLSGYAAQAVGDLVDGAVNALILYTDERWHAGDYPSAIRALLLCTDLDPQYEEGYLGAAWLLWSLGDDAAALRVYEAGMENNPTSGPLFAEVALHYYNTHRYEKARELYRHAFELEPNPRYLLFIGHSYRKEGNLEKALAVYEDVLRQFPNNVIAANNANLARQRLGRNPKPAEGPAAEAGRGE